MISATRLLVTALLGASFAGSAVSAQRTLPEWKIRDHLLRRMDIAGHDEKLPVYFVMRDRLGYHNFFPRIREMSLKDRRRFVIDALKRHSRRVQGRLCDLLERRGELGDTQNAFCSWLGNYVRVEATSDVIRDAAALDEVWEVWLDCGPSNGVCEDGVVVPPGASSLSPGNGPLAVGADKVWALGFRGQNVVVMNSDSGINTRHFSLRDRLWTNPGEIAGNGIDDDGNGLVDDIHGWNFTGNDNSLDDAGGHGTATAGVLVGDGACGPAVGIAPEGLVITGRIGSEADQWAAIQYALEMGADVQTSSHSYKNHFNPPPNYAMHRDIGEITLAAGLIRTNSTSNNGASCASTVTPEIAKPFNVSVPGNLPPPYRDPNQILFGRLGGVIGVGAHQLFGAGLDAGSPCGPSAWDLGDLQTVLPAYPLANWDPFDNDFPWAGGSQMGLLKPDIVAPTGTQTTTGSGASCQLGPFGGTSNATPVVAGTIMLWKGANPSLTPEDAAMILHQSANDAGLLPGKENDWGAGKVNALAGLEMALAVHRVNGESAWDVPHRSGTTITFEVDGAPNRPALMVVGLVRQKADFGIVTSGVGAQIYRIGSGTTGPTGSFEVQLPVHAARAGYQVFSQAFVDDRLGATGKILPSNVIRIDVQP